MTTRIGKIGRLNKGLRHELCARLENGEPNNVLVDWLNGLPAVQEVLRRYFDGRPITEQNMSEWKAGGFLEWQRLQETRDLARQLAEEGEVLDEDADGECFSDRLGLKVAVELARLMTQMLAEEGDVEQKWNRLKEVHRELSQLRRDDHRAAKLKLERRKQEQEEQAKAEAKVQGMLTSFDHQEVEKVLAPGEIAEMGRLLERGYGEKRPEVAELLYRVRTHRPWKNLLKEIRKQQNAEEKGKNPGESN